MRVSSEIITGVEIEHNGIRMSNKKNITGPLNEQFAMGETNVSEKSPLFQVSSIPGQLKGSFNGLNVMRLQER